MINTHTTSAQAGISTRTFRTVLLLIGISAVMLTGTGSAYAAAPERDATCIGETACLELAQKCRVFVALAGRSPDDSRISIMGCREPQRLFCVDAVSCDKIKPICLAANGTYTETTSNQGQTVTGNCKLPSPKPPNSDSGPSAPEGTIYCVGETDCAFLAGVCATLGGTGGSQEVLTGIPVGFCEFPLTKPRPVSGPPRPQ